MIETTLEIRLSADGGQCSITSDADGEVETQAQLVTFSHYVARVISLLGPARAVTLVQSPAKQEQLAEWSVAEYRALVRFVDGASGPRVYFRFKASDPDEVDRSLAVAVAVAALGDRGDDERLGDTLELASNLLARLGAAGQIRPDNEFDAALAVADVAWRYRHSPDVASPPLGLECPACGNAEGAGFDRRLWPSDTAVLARCGGCGAGVWRRGSRASRLLRDDVWSAMESLRTQLTVMAQVEPSIDGANSTLFGELKRVFADNGWPFREVQGAPVLLGVLSGPAGSWSFYAQAVEEKDLILLYSICPQRVPPDRRLAVAEYLTRANYGLAAGNFELDLDDGEVRYKSALPIQGDGPDAIALKRLMRANGIAMETYLPGITAVIAGASSASVE
jgi:hypothetical protein